MSADSMRDQPPRTALKVLMYNYGQSAFEQQQQTERQSETLDFSSSTWDVEHPSQKVNVWLTTFFSHRGQVAVLVQYEVHIMAARLSKGYLVGLTECTAASTGMRIV